MVHTIRLRGHWERTGTDGVTTWLRRFGRPTGGAVVDLRVVAATYPCRVRVNDGVVYDVADETESLRLDSLSPRNVLAIDSATEPEAVLELRDGP